MENPLHHFEIHPIIPLSLMGTGIDISISKAVIAMWIGLSVVFGLFMLVVKGGAAASGAEELSAFDGRRIAKPIEKPC